MKTSFRKDSIGVTAKELFSIEKKASEAHSKALELDRNAAQLREKATQARTILTELINSLQNAHPKIKLPDTFSINGLVIDISHGCDQPLVFEAPELGYLFETEPTT